MQVLKSVIGAAAVSATLAGAATGAVVFEERFDYADEAALDAAWVQVNGQSNYLTLTTTDAAVDHEPYANIYNGLIRRDLDSPISGADWDVSFKMLHVNKQRAGWLGLFNDAGTQGYGLLWDSGNAAAPDIGNGTVSIRKFDLTSELADWAVNGTQLGSTADTGHEMSTAPFADLSLSWDADTGTLIASVDGVEKLVRTDTAFSDFSRIYLKGNSYVKYDDIVVNAVPEPVGLLAILPIAGLLARRRRN